MTLHDYIRNYLMSKWDVLLAIHNLSGLKSLANNAKNRSSLKYLLIRYFELLISFLSLKWQEMWSLFDFVHQGTLLGTARTFKMEYENPITRVWIDWQHNKKHFWNILQLFIMCMNDKRWESKNNVIICTTFFLSQDKHIFVDWTFSSL